ncbi:MAG: cadherin-like beta sandwich domain-containing protein, partial [Chloroflexi bacterium]|nr:cadherin-like beta sandwich domain-containing protein [Chloroflexota bacterium]
SVPDGTPRARLTATAAHAKAALKAGAAGSLSAAPSGAAGAAVALAVGENAFAVEVTAEDGTAKTYRVTVTREARALSSSADLSGLSAQAVGADGRWSALDLGAFSAGTTAYSVTVPYGTTQARLTATAAHAKAALKAGAAGSLSAVSSGAAGAAAALSVGANAFTVQVTAEDGTAKTYRVTVTREAASSNADLSGLSAQAAGADGRWSGLDLGAFSAGTTAYSVTVPYGTTHARLTATAAHARAALRAGAAGSLSAVSSGSAGAAVALDVGANALAVEVTAEDGTARTYRVTVTREAAQPLTAAFENAPSEHDGGEAFTIDLRFSEALGSGGVAPSAASFRVQAGDVAGVERVSAGLWRGRGGAENREGGGGAASPPPGRAATGAVCAADGRALSNTPTASIGGPVRIRVEGARAKEGKD